MPKGRRGAHRLDDRRAIGGIIHMLRSVPAGIETAGFAYGGAELSGISIENASGTRPVYIQRSQK
jgi:hypothetical protein